MLQSVTAATKQGLVSNSCDTRGEIKGVCVRVCELLDKK